MRPTHTPAILSQAMQSINNPKVKLTLTVEHDDGALLAEGELGKWVSRIINYADGEELFKELLEALENHRSLHSTPNLAQRIREHLQKSAAE